MAFLDSIKIEIKGADIRRDVAGNDRGARRHAVGFLDKLINLVREYDGRLFARVYIKGIGQPFQSIPVYTSAVQNCCTVFHELLRQRQKRGLIIADSRNKPQNEKVSHSIFTQKFKTTGDPYASLLEMPTFGHSNNHAGLQIVDLLTSALIAPIAIHSYCVEYVSSVHVRPGYSILKKRYANDLKECSFRYQDRSGKWKGGITVNDSIAQRSSTTFFT